MLVLKLVLAVICALLLVVCYRTRGFLKKILKKKDEEITESLILKVKITALVISIIIFICSIVFVRI